MSQQSVSSMKSHADNFKKKSLSRSIKWKELKNRTHYVFPAIKITMMILAIVLIVLSEDISTAESCELQTALDFIRLNYIDYSCKYIKLREKSFKLKVWGIAELYFTTLGITFYVSGPKLFQKKRHRLAVLSFFFLLANAFFIWSRFTYNEFDKNEEETHFDFSDLNKTMLSSLEKGFTSDNMSSNDAISTLWNSFFIQYDCCAVNEVRGILNDFDKTPWCTTAGSCQNTSSQIPMTCCKSVTKEDYHIAPSNCHSSVADGTYKSSCISRMKSLSRDNVNEFEIFLISVFLNVCSILHMMELIILVAVIHLVYRQKVLQKSCHLKWQNRKIHISYF